MTATASPSTPASTVPAPTLMSRVVTVILGFKPIFAVAKRQARAMMVKRAATIGVDWPGEVAALRSRQSLATVQAEPDSERSLHPDWEQELAHLRNDALVYPDYYLKSFHAYEDGNLSWLPALEADVAGKTVHAKIWDDAGAKGDAMLRHSYHQVLNQTLSAAPTDILDIGCSAGHSTLGLRSLYPQAHCTGVELSPYFLTVAHYRERQQGQQQTAASDDSSTLHPIRWVHAAGEDTGLASASMDLASICLVVHELPSAATLALLREMRRVLRPGGHVAIMDMNPGAEVYAKMPPYVLTLLKSTEPYLDQYFALDIDQAFYDAGFCRPTVTCNSPRHRTLIAQTR